MDPMGNEHKHHGNFLLTQVTLNIFGLFDCKRDSNQSLPATFSVYLEENLIFQKENDVKKKKKKEMEI